MKRTDLLKRLAFSVPENKQVRMIIHTDAKNEADDQYAIMHHLLTPGFDVRGIIAAHFEGKYSSEDFKRGTSMQASYDEIIKILEYAEMDDVPVLHGSKQPLGTDGMEIPFSEGADFIIQEAMRDDQKPLFIAMQGGVTDLAIAYLKEPCIAEKLTAIWIGGEEYPKGGWEFNLLQDIVAANILFSSNIPLWQIPRNVYSKVIVSISELAEKVKPCRMIGEYLFGQLVEFNNKMGSGSREEWPQGETWCLGDQPTVTVLLQGEDKEYFHMQKVPYVERDMTYRENFDAREIRVYDMVDVRLTIEDFVSKLRLVYGKR